MKDKTETGTVAPAETTTRKDDDTTSRAELTLTSDGIASLLKSEFAADESEAGAGEEVQPAAVETTDTQTTEGQAGTETQTAETEQAAEEEVTTVKTPEALQAAIDEYEQATGGQLPPELQKMVDKRIGRLTAQREVAEAEVEELKAEVAQLKSAQVAAQAPLLEFVDEKALAVKEKNYRRFSREVGLFLNDAADDEERGRVERYMEANHLDLAGLKRQVAQVGEELEGMPELKRTMAEYRQVERETEPEVKEFFPWIDDKASPEYQLAQGVRQALPQIQSITPKHRLAIGVYVLGLKALAALKAAKAAKNGTVIKKPAVKPPPKSPAGSAAPAAARGGNGKAVAEEAARQQFKQAPTRESVTELLKIGLRS